MKTKRIAVSKEHYDIVKGIVKYTNYKEFDVTYGIVEFGLTFLLALSFEKIGGGEMKVTVKSLIDSWTSNPDAKKYSNAINEFMLLEDKKKYIGRRGIISLIGIHTIPVAQEQKISISGAAQWAGVSEREGSHYIMEAGITFMLIAEESDYEKVQQTVTLWMEDENVMKLANQGRINWEIGKEASEKNKANE